ncbi:MAG TPA: hypothetical protein PLD84_07350, partial [Chitinophagales bacterium]|nr:hypothetical protein [Chitinophagales bacterium]
MKFLSFIQVRINYYLPTLQTAILLTFFLSGYQLSAQSPNQVINTVNQRFAKVNDYTADVNVKCNITFIRIEPINAKVFYKRPDKFKVKATGILILPKQNANIYFATLAGTNSFTAVKTGEEMIGNVKTQVINVIPSEDTSDLVL